MKKFTLPLLLILLTGCASRALPDFSDFNEPATPYKAISNPGEYGYQSSLLNAEIIEVSFEGRGKIDSATVEKYAKRRAAELALEDGFIYLVINNVESNVKVSREKLDEVHVFRLRTYRTSLTAAFSNKPIEGSVTAASLVES